MMIIKNSAAEFYFVQFFYLKIYFFCDLLLKLVVMIIEVILIVLLCVHIIINKYLPFSLNKIINMWWMTR